jgi:TetR/AcrR family tetracycline transcriptional repressor
VTLTSSDVVDAAIGILDEYGLGDLTMRRLAAALGVQPGALYWHVANKQALLGAVADTILEGLDDDMPSGDWDLRFTELAHRLRAALLAHRDGAEVVAAAHALRTGRGSTLALLTRVLTDAGFTAVEAELAALAVLHYVLGHTVDEQGHAQSAALATEASGDAPEGAAGGPQTADSPLLGETARFGFGLSVFVDGLRTRLT